MNQPMSVRPLGLKLASLFGIALMGVVGFWILRSELPHDASWHPKCIFHQWTGLHCPGCGTTRALHWLALGNLAAAMRYNALLVIGLPVIGLLLWRQHRREQRGGPASPRLAWTVCFIVIGFFVLRNVPSPLRSWLAPPTSSMHDHFSQ